MILGGHSYTEFISEHGGASPMESAGEQGSKVTRVYDTGWDARFTFAVLLLGYSQIKTANGAKFLSRNIPHAYQIVQNSAGNFYLWANSVDRIDGISPIIGTGLGTTSVDTAKYTNARMTTTYTTLPYDVVADSAMVTQDAAGNPSEIGLERYVIVKVTPSIQALTINGGQMIWAEAPGAGTTNFRGSIPKPIPTANMQLTRFQIPKAGVASFLINPTVATPYLDNLLGTVNSDTVFGFTHGQLLLVGWEARPYVSPFGDRIFDIVFNIKQNRNRHNRLYRPLASGGGAYQYVSSDGTLYQDTAAGVGKLIFDPAAWTTQLFAVP